MAIHIPDMPCTLCCKPIASDESKVLLPPFVANKKDALYLFSDGVFHERCFEQDPRAALASRIVEKAATAGAPENMRCVACQELIVDPDNYFPTGLLTSDEANPAYRFNFVHLHRTHWREWVDREAFLRAVEHLQASEGWEGPRISLDPEPRWVIPTTRL